MVLAHLVGGANPRNKLGRSDGLVEGTYLTSYDRRQNSHSMGLVVRDVKIFGLMKLCFGAS
jgi:hypothetical protein